MWALKCAHDDDSQCSSTETLGKIIINYTYLFSSHHADRLTSEQVVDKFGDERAKEREK